MGWAVDTDRNGPMNAKYIAYNPPKHIQMDTMLQNPLTSSSY